MPRKSNTMNDNKLSNWRYQYSKKGGYRTIKSLKMNNLNVFKDKGEHRNDEIKTEGNETRTGGFGNFWKN